MNLKDFRRRLKDIWRSDVYLPDKHTEILFYLDDQCLGVSEIIPMEGHPVRVYLYRTADE